MLSLPISLCGLHEIVCSKNKWRMPITVDNLKTADVLCPECKVAMKAKDIPKHLGMCLQLLAAIMNNAMNSVAERPKINWCQPIDQDFIGLAGLDYWLKVNES